MGLNIFGTKAAKQKPVLCLIWFEKPRLKKVGVFVKAF